MARRAEGDRGCERNQFSRLVQAMFFGSIRTFDSESLYAETSEMCFRFILSYRVCALATPAPAIPSWSNSPYGAAREFGARIRPRREVSTDE